METTVETINQLYDERGDLLDTRAIAAITENPFYLQSKLDDLNEQVRLVEHIVLNDEAQEDWFILFGGVNLPSPYADCPQCETSQNPRFTHCLRCGSKMVQPEPAQLVAHSLNVFTAAEYDEDYQQRKELANMGRGA